MSEKYLRDIIDVERLREDKFNLILSGVGTGKSSFALEEDGLLKTINGKLKRNIKPSEILFVTSRKLIVDQQSMDDENIGEKFNDEQLTMLVEAVIGVDTTKREIPIITYNGLYYLLDKDTNLGKGKRIIDYFQVIIFDEAHAIIKDESFIKHMGRIKEFIISKLTNKGNETLLIGMTATGELLKEYLGVQINEVLDEPFYKYYVEELYAVNPLDVYSTIVKFQGKTLVMADSVDIAFQLKNKLGDSTKVLISKDNKRYTDEMNEIREYIINENGLPDECETLITTSCMREGINILPQKTIIENVVCYDVSTTTVMQFVGRYRGNVKRLVLVNSGTNLGRKLPMEKREYNEFTQLLNGNDEEKKYLDRIKHILKDGMDTKVIKNNYLENKCLMFKKYIEDNWLYKVIITEEQKKKIVEYAIDIGIRDKYGKKPTFKKLLEIVKELDFYVVHKEKSMRVTKKMKDKLDYIDLSDVNKITPYTIWK